MFKKEKGITLVALVITIIVLLILAGVTIAMVVGDNGILTRSRQSNFANQEAKIEENVELAIADLSAEITTDVSDSDFTGLTATELTKVFEKTFGAGKVHVTYVGDTDTSIGEGTVSADTCKTGEYCVILPSGDNDEKLDDKSAGDITITYTDAKLENSANKDWTAPLKYTVSVKAGYQLGDVVSADTNDGNYNNK